MEPPAGRCRGDEDGDNFISDVFPVSSPFISSCISFLRLFLLVIIFLLQAPQQNLHVSPPSTPYCYTRTEHSTCHLRRVELLAHGSSSPKLLYLHTSVFLPYPATDSIPSKNDHDRPSSPWLLHSNLTLSAHVECPPMFRIDHSSCFLRAGSISNGQRG